jgi:Zn-finger nucleic acid-binding protein
MQCHLCNVETERRSRADLAYWECPGCGAVWFDQGELESMISKRIPIALTVPGNSAGAPEEARAGMACPSCGPEVKLVPMTVYAARHVRILGCPVCFGHWVSRSQARLLIDRVCYGGPLGWLQKLFRRRAG